MKERFKELRKILKKTQASFAESIGLSQNFIAQIEIGTKEPSDRTIKDICRIYNVSEEWLRTGEGDMYKKRTRNQELAAFVNDVMEDVDESFKKRFILALSKLNESEWKTIEKIADELSKED